MTAEAHLVLVFGCAKLHSFRTRGTMCCERDVPLAIVKNRIRLRSTATRLLADIRFGIYYEGFGDIVDVALFGKCLFDSIFCSGKGS